ncbi:MAG TPA: adenosine deaminase [Chloroflexota bacterium]|nr:adenosine deaminase [Chloroflexota bacterium]
MMTESTAAFARRIPKVEMHVHLEGSMQPDTLLRLARKHHVDIGADTVHDVESLYGYTDFLHFLEVYQMSTQVLRDAEDFALITYEFLRNQAAQNVRYSEVMVSLSDHLIRGIDAETVMQGILEGQRRGEHDFKTRMAVILDAGRQWPDLVPQVQQVAARYAGRGVIGFGIGGDEANFPPELFTDEFAAAREAGLRLTCHAGEVAGADSMWGAIALGAERLGHGVHAHDDPTLYAELRSRRVALDMCPVSNVRTGAIPTLHAHPIRRYLEDGLLVTVNSDDPPMFGTSIANEYRALAEDLGLERAQIAEIALNGIRASFLPQDEKQRMEAEFRTAMGRLDE